MRSPVPMHFRIETLADAERYRDDLIEKLGWTNPVTNLLLSCDIDDPCRRSACPRCTHSFRDEVLPQLASLFNQPLDCLRFVTMYVHVVDEGHLAEVDALRLKGAMRRLIARADISGRGLMVGAIEPEWRAAERKWLIHLHVISSDIDDETWARVRRALTRRASKALIQSIGLQARRVLRNDPVSDIAAQLSYCIKFVTYDRLLPGESVVKGKPVSLKGKPLDELVGWRAQYAPDDFLFLYGAKRLNGQFVRLVRSA
jgi:hypothetical protein